jgi:inosine-uridine nucleoside N-ribohydrolase
MRMPLRYLHIRKWITITVMAVLSSASASSAAAQSAPPASAKTKIIIDTDIGDDLDDAFALGLALNSPEVDIVGITTAWGDTKLRARLVDRLLAQTGRASIPVAEGIHTETKFRLTQARWAEAGPPAKPHPAGVDFLLEKIRQYPGEITLVGIGPLTNVGAAIERDPATFRKLKRVVIMGGSIRKHYDDLGYTPDRGPEPEYNIYCDVAASQKLFTSGVPLYVMPLDSTQLKLDETKRALLFRQSTSLTDALTLLYHQWGQQTPTLFDAMAVAYVIEPKLCPTQPLHIVVDGKGTTLADTSAPANANACLASDSDDFFRFLLPRLMRPSP